MEEIGASSSIRKRLGLQNEVLKWITEFLEKIEARAKSTTEELNALLDQAKLMETDMKNTVISFNKLSYQLPIDHRVSDECDANESTKGKTVMSAWTNVLAQDYEIDILPRYKESLSLGLSACKDHFEKKNQPIRSVVRGMSAKCSLPHIIGSEEYTHDNTCGLNLVTEDLTMKTLPDELSWITEPDFLSSDPEKYDLQKGPHKGESEPFVTAVQDFKAMLEAALLNPYKYYDDGNIVAHDTQNSVEELVTNSGELYSSLVSGSLFDADSDSLSLDQKESHTEIIEENTFSNDLESSINEKNDLLDAHNSEKEESLES